MQTPSSASATSDPQNSTNGPSDSASTHGSRLGIEHILTDLTRWWRVDVSGTVDQAAVIEKRRAECELTARYLLMTCMSAGIAILGMLLSSPAVVIGAMLLSPLMDPIMGVGFALAIGDFHWLRRSVRSLGLGVGLAILFCAIIGGDLISGYAGANNSYNVAIPLTGPGAGGTPQNQQQGFPGKFES